MFDAQFSAEIFTKSFPLLCLISMNLLQKNVQVILNLNFDTLYIENDVSVWKMT